jgi:hypothetical protein
MPKLANIVAMCDVNDRRAAPYYKAIPQAKKYHDFRKMLDEMDKQIDASPSLRRIYARVIWRGDQAGQGRL